VRFDGGEGEEEEDSNIQRVSYMPSPRVGKLLWPTFGGELVSGFGRRSGTFHDGLDIAAPTGTPVRAAHDGVVVYSSNELSGYGNLIILQSSSSLITVYGHNSRLLVKKGEKVRKGDTIARVGATGRAQGPHLHFEVRMRDRKGRYVAVDPLPLLGPEQNPQTRFRVNESLTPLLARLSGPFWR
jgi:murein DD-endopeptidase MepM/ murein hydrolase activator NlpD